MDELKSVASSKSKNYNKRIVRDLCNKEMRSDALKSHRAVNSVKRYDYLLIVLIYLNFTFFLVGCLPW